MIKAMSLKTIAFVEPTEDDSVILICKTSVFPISTKAPFVIVFVTQQPLRGQSGRDRTGGLKNPNLAVYL